MIAQVVLLAQIAAFPGVESYQTADPAIEKMRTICGPNSLYCLLRFWEIPATYADVERVLPIGPRGASLLSLKQAALHFGLQTRVRKYAAKSLEELRIPAITHHYFDMKTEGSNAHYVLLRSFTNNNVEFIDGTTGLLNNVTAAKFYSTWSGYALEPVNNSSAFASPMIAIGAAVGLLCIPKFLRAAAARTLKITRKNYQINSFIALSASIAMGSAGEAGAATERNESWRISTNDSSNCIKIYTSVLYEPVSWAQIEAELGSSRGQSSLLDLRRAFRALGFPLRIAKPSISDLATLPLPAIVHMVDEEGRHGGYFLLINPGKNKFETINCTSATIESISAEEFRCRWSGYALVAEEKQLPWLQGALLGLGVFGCGSLMYRKFAPRS